MPRVNFEGHSHQPVPSRVDQQAALELEQVDPAGPASTTYGTPTSTQTGPQPGAGPFDQTALPELDHADSAG